MKPMSERKHRGNSEICFADVNSYASISLRWRTQKALQMWWKSLPEMSQVEWYRKMQSNGFGKTRDFSQTIFTESETHHGQDSRRAADDMIPF